MDGENNGTPYLLMDDLGGIYPPLFLETAIFSGWGRRVFFTKLRIWKLNVTVLVPEKGNNYTLKLEISMFFLGGARCGVFFFFSGV